MKRLTRILVTLMMVCALILSTSVCACGWFDEKRSWGDFQTSVSGGDYVWFDRDKAEAIYTISVTKSVKIKKYGKHSSGIYYKDSAGKGFRMFDVNNDKVNFWVDPNIELEADGIANGGIVYVKANNCTIDGLNVIKSFTKGEYAGAIYVEGNNCTIKNCDFTNCSSSYCGGAIYVDGDGCTIEDCTFNNCSSQYGGAIYLEGYGTEINRCTFTSCEATRDGGAIYANDDAQIKDNCTFKNNIAKEGYGGAICDDNGPGQVVISDCNFEGGSCGKYGIWIYGWGDAKVERCTPSDSDHYYYIEDIDSTLVSSIFSSGNIWIIGGIGVIAIVAIILIVLKRRKKTT